MKIINLKSQSPYFWAGISPLILTLPMILILLFLPGLPDKLPLFYSLPWGEDQLATRSQMLIIPAAISLVTLTNLTISWHLHPSQLFFKNTLLFISFLTALILIVSFIKIIFIFI